MKVRILLILLFAVQIGFGQIYIDSYRFVSAAPTNLLLDDYPGAAVAYSLRKLDKDYTGNAIEIRRSSDGNTQNIGFSGNDLDEGSINTFCSGTTCTVQTWYDQSGNGNNATQATPANQPTIYTGGTVVTDGGKPTVSFDASNDFFSLNTGIDTRSQLSFFAIMKRKASGTSAWTFASSSNQIPALIVIAGEQIYITTSANNTYKRVDFNNNNRNLYSLIDQYSLNNYNLYVNGSFLSQPETGVLANSFIVNTIGARTFDNSYGNQNIQELIYYPSNQSTNRANIETNINSYYSIY